MLTKPRYSAANMVWWTRRELGLFIFYGTAVTAAHVLGSSALQLPWAPVGVLGTAVAFMVGFQNNSAYGRIWEARKLWGGIVNASRTWAIKTAVMVNGDRFTGDLQPDELLGHRKVLVHRHIAWLTTLRYAMREPRPWEEFDRHRTNREWSEGVCIPERETPLEEALVGLLSPKEWESVRVQSNRSAAVLKLQSEHLAMLQRRGLLWEFAHLDLEALLAEILSLQGGAERIKNFPYPRQYATLSFQFVWIFLLLLPLAAVPEFAEVGASLTAEWPALSRHFVWLAAPFCALVSWVFHTMERIGRVGENPFEGSANDVPISAISRGIEIDLRQMLGEPESVIPAAFPVERNVQM